jgi:hypothetical protein
MIGNITQPNDYPLPDQNSKIYLLDIRSFTWVYSFELSTPSTPSNTTPPNPATTNISGAPLSTNTSESSNQGTSMRIVIAALSGVVGTVLLMTIGFFGYRWYKKRQREVQEQDGVLRVYGNHGNTY